MVTASTGKVNQDCRFRDLFGELDGDIEGLIHISEVGLDSNVHMEEKFKLQDEVTAKDHQRWIAKSGRSRSVCVIISWIRIGVRWKNSTPPRVGSTGKPGTRQAEPEAQNNQGDSEA